MDALRANFLGADFRPVGLTAGSRALVRVVDDLRVAVPIAYRRQRRRNAGRDAGPAVRVLRDSAPVLQHHAGRRPRRARRADLDEALAELRSVAHGRYREDIVDHPRRADDDAAIERGPASC